MDLTSTEQEIVRMGLASASLLANETFTSVIRELGIECFAAFTETKPADSAAREDTYNLYQGLQAIEAQLRQRVSQQEELVRKLDQAHADLLEHVLRDDDEPITIQGD